MKKFPRSKLVTTFSAGALTLALWWALASSGWTGALPQPQAVTPPPAPEPAAPVPADTIRRIHVVRRIQVEATEITTSQAQQPPAPPPVAAPAPAAPPPAPAPAPAPAPPAPSAPTPCGVTCTRGS